MERYITESLDEKTFLGIINAFLRAVYNKNDINVKYEQTIVNEEYVDIKFYFEEIMNGKPVKTPISYEDIEISLQSWVASQNYKNKENYTFEKFEIIGGMHHEKIETPTFGGVTIYKNCQTKRRKKKLR